MIAKFWKWFVDLFKKEQGPLIYVVRVDYLGRSAYYVKGKSPHWPKDEYYDFHGTNVYTYTTYKHGTKFETYEAAEEKVNDALAYYHAEMERKGRGYYVERETVFKNGRH